MRIEDELKMKKFENAQDRAVLNIMFTGNWLSDRMNSLLKPWGISDQQYNVLRILKGQKGKPINLYMIRERMIHRMSNATRLVEKLRKKGFVRREICESNRRMVEIVITNDGLRVLNEIDEVVGQNRKVTNKKLSNEEATILGDLLDKLRE